MSLENLQLYLSNYEKNAKKIAVRSFLPIAENNTFKKSHGNYDLYFNLCGNLLESEHFEKNNTKIIYTYNEKNNVTKIIKFESITNELITTVIITYDKEDRIIHEKEYDNDMVIETTYKYQGNLKTIFITSTDKYCNDRYTCYETKDDRGKIVERKELRNSDELISWEKYEYDADDNVIEIYSLNEKGDLDAKTNYFRYINDIETGYYFESEELSYTRKIETVFNEKRHWTRKTNYNDEKILFVIERKLEFFSEDEIPDDHSNLNNNRNGLLLPDSTFYNNKEFKSEISFTAQITTPYNPLELNKRGTKQNNNKQ